MSAATEWFVQLSFGTRQTETVLGGEFYGDVWRKIRQPLKQRKTLQFFRAFMSRCTNT
jgi:hypothetical protein